MKQYIQKTDGKYYYHCIHGAPRFGTNKRYAFTPIGFRTAQTVLTHLRLLLPNEKLNLITI